jgi:hypothetical protein
MKTVYCLIGSKNVCSFRKPLFIGSCRVTRLERVNGKIFATLIAGGSKFDMIVTEDTIVKDY